MAHHLRPQAASVEDYSSDLNETLPNTRRVASSKQTRRASGLSQMMTREQDGFSDSGYSSHAPTATSSESVHGAPTTESPPLPPMNQAPLKRRPTQPSRDRSKHRSPTKGSSRTSSPGRPQSRAASKPVPHEDCDCKLCTGKHLPALSPLDTALDTNYPPFSGGNGGGNGGEHQYAPSSRNYPMPGSFPQDRPTELPARPGLHRASTSHSMRPARPVSYHAGQNPMNGAPYSMGQQGYFPQTPYQQGPPPALANYSNMYPPSQFPPPNPATTVPPQLNSAFAPPPQYTATRNEPYWPEGQQQPQYSVRGPPRTPVVEYPYQQPPPPVNRRASLGPSHDGMPPLHSMPRPNLRYSSSPTSNGYDISRTASVPPQSATVDPVTRRVMTPQPQSQPQPRPKRQSISAHPRKPPSHSSSTKLSVDSNSSSDRRRPSLYDNERARDEHERELERDQAYQGAIATRTPLTVEALRAARGQRALGSDSGSQSRESHSSHEGSEDRTHAAVAFSVPDSEADNFTMRYPAGTPVKLEFTGRALATGRTISLRPGEQGEPYQLTIGTRRYVEHRGCAQIEYAQTARREIEDCRRHRETRPANHSRRPSRSGYHRD
ncbi:MAG: hypothetical protein M1840_005385 [Geoglossum simile]|nr:MAG: hypothetical protein M1840_005385 [Geoglossum simile]